MIHSYVKAVIPIYILFGVDSVRLCYSMFTVVQSSVRVTDSRQFLMLSLYQIFVLILILSVCQQQIGRWIFLLFRLTCQYNFILFSVSLIWTMLYLFHLACLTRYFHWRQLVNPPSQFGALLFVYHAFTVISEKHQKTVHLSHQCL